MTKKEKLQLESENIQSRANALSKEIGQLFAKGQKDEASAKKQEVESLNAAAKPVREKLTEAEKEIDELLVRLPNLPSEKVPAGRTPAENVTVKEGGDKPQLAAGALPHWELAKKYSLIDFELGNKVTGSGFPFYTGKGAKFQRCLQLFLPTTMA